MTDMEDMNTREAEKTGTSDTFDYVARIGEFREYLYYNEKSTATIQKYIGSIEKFTEYLNGQELTKERLLEYREWMERQYSPQTVNVEISAINAWLKFCKMDSLGLKMLRVQRESFLSEDREITKAEYQKLLSTAKRLGKERLYLIMMTLGGTGIRISELKYITVEAIRCGRAQIRMKGKNRTILLPVKLCKQLKRYVKRRGICSGYIFRTRSGKPVDRSNVCHEMKAISEEAGVRKEKVFPHNFRHLFARLFYSMEKNIAHLADVLGHSRIETTRIYVAASARDYERILNRMELIL